MDLADRMDKKGWKSFDPLLSPTDVNRKIETSMRAIQDIGGQLELVRLKKGSRAFSALSSKYNVEKVAANFSRSVESYKTRVNELKYQHSIDYREFVKRATHNGPINSKILLLQKKVQEEKQQMVRGNKFDSDLSDVKLRQVEAERARRNAPYTTQINVLEQQISKLRSQLW